MEEAQFKELKQKLLDTWYCTWAEPPMPDLTGRAVIRELYDSFDLPPTAQFARYASDFFTGRAIFKKRWGDVYPLDGEIDEFTLLNDIMGKLDKLREATTKPPAPSGGRHPRRDPL